jgi:hypothetical protein
MSWMLTGNRVLKWGIILSTNKNINEWEISLNFVRFEKACLFGCCEGNKDKILFNLRNDDDEEKYISIVIFYVFVIRYLFSKTVECLKKISRRNERKRERWKVCVNNNFKTVIDAAFFIENIRIVASSRVFIHLLLIHDEILRITNISSPKLLLCNVRKKTNSV